MNWRFAGKLFVNCGRDATLFFKKSREKCTAQDVSIQLSMGQRKVGSNCYFRIKLLPMFLLQVSGSSDILLFLLVGIVLVLTFLFLRRKR
jgi:hypothetical protein